MNTNEPIILICEFCLNGGDAGQGCFSCGAVTPDNNINSSKATISLDFKLVDIFDLVIDEVLGKDQLTQIALALLNDESDAETSLLIDSAEFMQSLREQLS